MRILVLGGTAFLSAEIVRQAVAGGHRTACLARGTTGPPPPGAEWIRADRSLGANAYDGVAGEWDAVIDVARNPEFTGDALTALAGRAGHWTAVSSCSVYANHSVPGAAEDAELLPPLPPGTESTAENYGESKVAIEEATLAATQGNAHLCRAGLIAGPGDTSDRYGYWPARCARTTAAGDNQPILVPDIEKNPTQVIDVRDLAAWILFAAEQKISGALNALGEQVPFGGYFVTAREVAGHTGPVVTADPEWLAGQGVSYWAGPDSLPLWLPPGHDGFMARSNKAARAAGLVLRPWQQTLADTLSDERTRGVDRPRKAGLAPATEARLLASLGG